MHVPVLPGAEPKEDEAQIVGAGSLYQGIDIREVELARLGFELFPVDRRFESIGVQRGHRFPHLRKLAGPGAGVMNLSSEDEVGTPVDEQGMASGFVDQTRRFGGEKGLDRTESEECQGRNRAHGGG